MIKNPTIAAIIILLTPFLISGCSFNWPSGNSSNNVPIATAAEILDTPTTYLETAEAPDTVTPSATDIVSQIFLHKTENKRGATVNAYLAEEREFSSNYPAVIEVEISGDSFERLELLTLMKSENQQQIVLNNAKGGVESGTLATNIVPAGVHELAQVWRPVGYYLTNGTDGVYVTSVVSADGGEIKINGRYQTNNRSVFQDAVLIYSEPGDRPDNLLMVGADEQIQPAAGARFEVINSFYNGDGLVTSEAAITLSLDDEGRLVLEERPLPAGIYELVFQMGMETEVNESEPLEIRTGTHPQWKEEQIVVNPFDGYQLALPASWNAAEIEESKLTSQNGGGSINLTITTHLDLGGNGPAELSAMALRLFGPVTVLYQDRRIADSYDVFRTVYAYDTEQESRTGVLAAMVKDGIGYVVDIDGSQTAEGELSALANQFLDSWQFRPAADGDKRGNWLRYESNSFSTAVPYSFILEELDNDWIRMTSPDNRSFLAFRAEGDQPDSEESFAYWQQVAVEDGAIRKNKFGISEAQSYQMNGLDWLRRDFEYKSGAAITRGTLQARETPSGSVLIWAEAPADSFHQVYQDIFLPVMASITVAGE